MTTTPPGPPAPTLVIDASTGRGSVALVAGDRALTSETVAVGAGSAEGLMPAIARALESAHLGLPDLDRIVCGSGPGSFTSLRIAAALAKGLAAVGVMRNPRPLASVSSLLLTAGAAADRLAAGSYLVVADAMRGERYAMLVERAVQGTASDPPAAVRAIGPWRRLSVAAAAAWAREAGAQMVGPGCPIDAWPEAWSVTRLWPAVVDVDPVSWEPDYGRLAEAQVRRERARLLERDP